MVRRPGGKAHRFALAPLLSLSDDILVCSQKQFSAVSRVPGIGGRVRLTPIGNVIPVTGVRRERSPEEPVRLVYFGFLWTGRNIETLLRALKAVIDRGIGATLTLVGAIKEPEYGRALETLAADLGVSEFVFFLGESGPEVISQALADADLCLLPFATGVSTGRTTFSAALAHGAPVVTMSVPENLVPEFVDGENLLLAPATEEALFIEQVVRGASDADLRNRLRLGARELFQRFAWSNLARQILELPSYQEARK